MEFMIDILMQCLAGLAIIVCIGVLSAPAFLLLLAWG